jgi:polysaccharide export outer membrane protein
VNAFRFVAALALICANLLFAAEASADAPKTSDKKSPAEHVIQPPDVIQIEMLKVIPKPPYRVEVFDVLEIRANIPPDKPLDSPYIMVEAEGTINLGPTYGSIRVAGMTVDEIRATLNKSLNRWIKDPTVSVQLARASNAQPISGQYLVGPDGTINLRQYGVVKIVGKTAIEACEAVQDHLKQYLDSPKLSVDVLDNSKKVYYVITLGADLGDSIRRIQITGTETVCVPWVIAFHSTGRICWHPKFCGDGRAIHIFLLETCESALTWLIASNTATNYRLLPGDRLFIADDELVTFSNVAAKLAVTMHTVPSENAVDKVPSESDSPNRGGQGGSHYNRNRNGL